MTLDHPKVKKVIRQCQRRVMKLTGNSAVMIMFHNPKKAVPFEMVFNVICEVTKMPVGDVTMRCRKREYVIARQLICFYARHYSLMHFQPIADRLGYSDHTTAINGVNVIKSLLETNDEYVLNAVARINKQLNVNQ